MSQYLKKVILIVTDFLAIQTAFFIWCKVRWTFGFFAENDPASIFRLSLLIFVYWFLLLLFFGQYQTSFAKSRTDELIDIIKIVSIGVFFIFLMTAEPAKDFRNPLPASRMMLVLYWLIMMVCTGLSRLVVRTVHRKLLVAGYGHRKALIVGWGGKAWKMFDDLQAAPALGYRVVGFVSPEKGIRREEYGRVPLVGHIGNIRQIIRRQGVQELIIAMPRRSERQLEEIIRQCDGTPVGIKIVPDLYQVITGQVLTNQLYGFPLIEILPQLMPQWEKVVKRTGDFMTALAGLILFLPAGLLLAGLIRIDSKGPVFYMQERVGKNGRHFRIVKFRSMVADAEKHSGPVWAVKKDPRITRTGRLMRKLRLDEVPQLFNVLTGDMSLVGPRPERPYFVEKLSKIFPLYARRLRIQPGITGWAQVKGGYDTSLEDVKKKIEYDLYYLENMSLRMDLKIILSTLYVVLRGKGH